VHDLKGSVRLALVQACLCMFHLAPITISSPKRQLYCGTDKTDVFLHLVVKIRDLLLE
jgi:hypothetical protein